MRLSLICGLLLLTGCGESTRINGGGASFIYPIMLHWSRVYDREFQVEIDYQSTGSGNGIQQTIARTIQFGCTDAPIKNEQLDRARGINGEIIHIPLAMGGVVPIYNLPEATEPLRLNGSIIANIFLGKITFWDDAEIKAINPEVALPHREIVVARRSDSSGTTAIFTDYLSQANAEWKEKVKSGTTVKWPVGVGQRGNEGVAGMVSRSPYSIGYVELIYAIQNKLAYGAVETRDSEIATKKASRPLKDRTFLLATLETVTAAADAKFAEIPEDLRYSLVFTKGENSYPIAGTNWAVLYVKQPASNGPQLVEFLRWTTRYDGDAQRHAKEMGYAPLPRALCERCEKRLNLVTFE